MKNSSLKSFQESFDSRYPLVLVSDMDATMLRNDSSLPPEVVTAVGRFVQAGGVFTVASGRPHQAIAMYQDLSPYIGLPVITCNGGSLYDIHTDESYQERNLPQEVRDVTVAVLEKYPHFGCGAYEKGGYPPATLRGGALTEEVLIEREHTPAPLRSPEEVPLPWFKVFFASDQPQDIADCASWLESMDIDMQIILTEGRFIDLGPKGVSKGKGVRSLAAMYNIPLSNFVAIGDSTNDLPMLEIVGKAFCVANAAPEVKAIATPMAGDNEHLGVVECIEKHLLPFLEKKEDR